MNVCGFVCVGLFYDIMVAGSISTIKHTNDPIAEYISTAQE